MKELHSLLRRQLRSVLGKAPGDGDPLAGFPEAGREAVARLLDLVNDAYRSFDQDRLMLERSIELSSSELLQANTEILAILSAFPDIFMRLDGSGRILECRGGASADLLLPEAELIGRRIQCVPGGDAGRRFDEAIRQVLATKRMANLEYTLSAARKKRFFEARLVPLHENEILVIIRDITVRREAEIALSMERERVGITLASIADAVIATDGAGRVQMMNQAAEELTDWSAGEALGRPIEEIVRYFSAGTQNRMMENPVRRVLASGSYLCPTRGAALVSRTGRETLVADSGAPIRDPAGQVIGVVLVIRDITGMRLLEDERLKASKLESLGILAGGIAHDFNNMLTTVQGYVTLARELLPDPDTASESRDSLVRAESAVYRARDLSRQLLTFSRGGSPVKREASVRQLLDESAAFALRGSNVSWQTRCAEDLESIEVDPGQLSQALHNLFVNAMQAMPDGGEIRIEAAVEDVPPGSAIPLRPGRYVRIGVKDHGHGIPPEHLTRIFDPYFSTKKNGTGLGLASAYSIVRRHSGHIGVRSKPGEGATFEIRLPASGAGVRMEPASAPAPAARVARPKATGMRILVMDDLPEIRELACGMLKCLGYDTEVAEDGFSAVERYRHALRGSAPFDAVIFDLTVPGGMGGKDAVAEILKLDPRAKAIVASGYSNDPVLAKYRDFGFRGMLMKPFTLFDLGHALEQVLHPA